MTETVNARTPTISPESRPAKRFFRWASGVGLVVTLVAAGGWYYYSTRPAERFRRGRIALRQGDLVRAETYAELLKNSGDTDWYRLLMGEMALRRKSPASAIDYLTAIPPESPPGAEAAILLAQASVALRRPYEAMSALYFVLQKNSQHIEAHRWLATIYYDQGDYLRAIPHLEKVAELDPKDARPHRLLGLIYRDLDKLDDAVSAYQESLRRDPHPIDEEEVRVELAVCLMKQHRESDAMSAVEGLDTPAASAIRIEGMIATGQEDVANRLLDQELAKHPNYIGLLRLKGEQELLHGEPGKAVEILERVVREAPHDLRSRTNLARAYHVMGRKADEEAENLEIKRMIDLMQKMHDKNVQAMADPWDAAIRYELADLCERLHRPELAQMWRRAAQAAERARR
jgi:Flp pilus assembly protein TadD